MTLQSKQTQHQRMITEIQIHGIRPHDKVSDYVSRRGGAGPTDHQAVIIDGMTVMVPTFTQTAWRSPFRVESDDSGAKLIENGIPVKDITFIQSPKFYDLSTADGVPYHQIATLHGKDVLATTVLQRCIRYESRRKACKFCSIGQSLDAGRTIERKTPEQLAEVAKAAVELDGIQHMVMTTGTPATPDRGAAIMCESAKAIRNAVDIPIQAQCEPPSNSVWYQRMKDSGIDSLGMHLEVVTPYLRDELMPGKADISVEQYMTAFKDAVKVFGRGQVSTYILAGLGDSKEAILEICNKLIEIGVYPFVVPFVPITGTPLEDFPPPSGQFMESILVPLSKSLKRQNMYSKDIKAGCGRCGACSTLSGYER